MAKDDKPTPDASGARGGRLEEAWVLEVSEPRRGRVMRASLPMTGFGAPDVEVLENPADEAGYRDPFARHISRKKSGVRRLEAGAGAAPARRDRNTLLWGLGALAAAILLLAGLAFLANALSDDDSGTSADAGATAPASLGGTTFAALGESCRVKFDRAIIGPPPLDRLQALGVSLEAIRPAIATSRAQYALPVVASNNVICGELGGTVGLRGGLVFSNPEGRLALRRPRLDGDTGLIRTFSASGALEGADRITVDLDKARWIQADDFATLRVPLELTDRGARDLNVTLGIDGFAQGDDIGVLSLTGQARIVTVDDATP